MGFPVRFPLPPHAHGLSAASEPPGADGRCRGGGPSGTTIDLTDPNLALAGQDATDVQGGVRLLWPGNGGQRLIAEVHRAVIMTAIRSYAIGGRA